MSSNWYSRMKKSDRNVMWIPQEVGLPCQALDDDGNQCRRIARWRGPYHGDPQTLDRSNPTAPSWVTVALCSQHAALIR